MHGNADFRVYEISFKYIQKIPFVTDLLAKCISSANYKLPSKLFRGGLFQSGSYYLFSKRIQSWRNRKPNSNKIIEYTEQKKQGERKNTLPM